MTSGGRKVDVGGVVPDYKYVRNKTESEFLTGQAEYSRSCERLAMERSMIKSSTLFYIFECGPLPPTSTSRPPDIICGKCSLAFHIFATLSCIILSAN